MRRDTQAILATLHQHRDHLFELIELMKASLESERSLWAQHQALADKVVEVEAGLLLLLRNKTVRCVYDWQCKPLTGIRRPLCPTD